MARPSPLFVYKLTPDDGDPFVVGVGARDVLAWERAEPGRSQAQLQDSVRAADAYWLAHRAAKRAGLVEGPLKQFEDTHELEGSTVKALAEFRGEHVDDDGDGADPT